MIKSQRKRTNENKKRFGISADALRIISIVTMFIDHIAAVLIFPVISQGNTVTSTGLICYAVMRYIGRTAFPIFAFQIVEGYFHTRSKWRYAFTLLLFACISEVPFDYAHSGEFTWNPNNVMWTLLIGFLVIWAMEAWKADLMKKAGFENVPGIQPASEICLPGNRYMLLNAGRLVTVLAGCSLAYYWNTDYDMKGVFLIVLFYMLHSSRKLACILGYVSFIWEPACLPAFLLLYLYDGTRHFKGKIWKYFCYLFYPVHLAILYMILQKLIYYCYS